MVSTFPDTGSRHLADLAATHAFGAEFGAALTAGDVVILTGPLGAGKTSLTQGIAQALQVRGRITSPTFQLARRHPPLRPHRPGLVHVDAYRLREQDAHPHLLADELESLDLDAYLDTDVVVIEWGEGLAERLAPRPWLLVLDRDDVADTRAVAWSRGA